MTPWLSWHIIDVGMNDAGVLWGPIWGPLLEKDDLYEATPVEWIYPE